MKNKMYVINTQTRPGMKNFNTIAYIANQIQLKHFFVLVQVKKRFLSSFEWFVHIVFPPFVAVKVDNDEQVGSWRYVREIDR